MATPAFDRWRSLWLRLGASGDSRAAYDELTRHYSETHRAYHNSHHISHCLEELDSARSLAISPDTVETAIWFHDAIYDPRAKDNEEQSATLAETTLTTAGVGPAIISQVRSLILITKHAAPPQQPDEILLVDIDLAILGQGRERYEAFEQQIREEYAWVPASDFAKGRGAILQSFLNRPSIYGTDRFRECYEQAARTNLAWALARLRS